MNKSALEAATLAKLGEIRHQLDINVSIAKRDHPEGGVLPHSQEILAGHIKDRLAELEELLARSPAPAETEEDRALANFDKIADSFFASNDAMLPAPAKGVRVTDLEKFCLEQIWRPYQRLAGYEARLKRLPMSVDETAAKLGEDSEWSRAVLDRVLRVGFRFPSYIQHPLADIIRSALLPSESEKAGMPADRDWYARKAALEADHEVGAGRRLTNTINPTDDEIADFERLALEALPKWAQDRIRALEPAEKAGVMGWCQPMDCGKHTPRHFIVRFEDADRGYAVFTDEAEAYEFFRLAEWKGYNCYLFGAMPRKSAAPAPSPATGEA